MNIKTFLGIFRDLFLTQPRNACPHCGGIRCIGACQFNEKQAEKLASSAQLDAEGAKKDTCLKDKYSRPGERRV